MTKRSDEDLVKAAGHIAYEMQQMVEAELLLDDERSAILTNALLESELLHARGLIELLLRRSKKEDIKADDFCTGWQLPKKAKKNLGRIKKAIDQHLAHLTWARVDDGKQEWPYPSVVEGMRDLTEAVKVGHPESGTMLAGALTLIEDKRKNRRLPTTGPTFISTTTEHAVRTTSILAATGPPPTLGNEPKEPDL